MNWIPLDVRTIRHLQAAWGNHRLRHRHCAWLKAREVQKRGRCCCGQPGIEKRNKFILGPGGHGEEPCKGISFFGVGPQSTKLVGTGFPTFVDSYPGSHIYIYTYKGSHLDRIQWEIGDVTPTLLWGYGGLAPTWILGIMHDWTNVLMLGIVVDRPAKRFQRILSQTSSDTRGSTSSTLW